LIVSRGGLSIVGDIERVQDGDDRVVLKLERELNSKRTAQSYDLRPEDGCWRIFNVQRARGKDIVVDR